MFILKNSLWTAKKTRGICPPFMVSVPLLKNKLLPFVLGIPLFFCLHHYKGIVGDARLYLIQVIHKIRPESFQEDPPFMFGNQDDYGIFSFFYEKFLTFFTIDYGTLLFTLLGHVLCYISIFYFVLQYSKKMRIRLWFLPLIIGFVIYSGYNMPNDHIFFWRYIESFNASRLHSIAIAILGLGTLFANKKNLSLLLFLFGTAIHPLTSGWCLPLWLFFYYPKTRVPIAIISSLLPLTFLLHKGPFDIYPADWGNCTHDHPVTYLMIWRESLAVLFFGFFVPKFSKNKRLLQFSKAAFWTLLIGLYWSATGGFAKHILIYQVQTWRVEWLFFILAMPIFVNLIYEQVQSFRHKQDCFVTSRHISLFFLGFAVFMPAPNTFPLIIAIALLLIPTKPLRLNLSLLILTSLSIASASLQELNKLLFSGAITLKALTFSDLFMEITHLVFLQFLWVLVIIALCLREIVKKDIRKGLLIILVLVFYVFFPQYCLLPAALFAFILFFSKRIRFFLLAMVLLLCVGDCFFNVDLLRISNVLVGCPKRILESFELAFPIIICVVLLFINISKKVRLIIFSICLITSSSLAFIDYDIRDQSLKQAESQLQMFKANSIFPQIKDRAKMFYYVSGEYADDSRIQFLTGSYFGETTPIGEPLFKEQFREERRRLNNIVFKEQRDFIARRGFWIKFVKDSLSKRNVLLDRVKYLCSTEEISYFVSNLRFSDFEKIDLYKMNNYETIYLYGCPDAEN